MKRNITLLLIAIAVLVLPTVVKAESDSDHKIISKTTKYYKTITEYENVERDSYGNISSGDVVRNDSYEISKEEFDNADLSNTIETRNSTVVETTYKYMMTTVEQMGNGNFNYRNQLGWLNFPSVRNYDIIGIGHIGDVTLVGTPNFGMDYTTTSGLQFQNFWFVNQDFTYGSSGTFLLPLPNLSSLTISYDYDVEKTNPNSTLYFQAAYGDYSHGIDPDTTLTQSLNHVVNQNGGIILGTAVYSLFDSINEAAVYWSGVW